MKWETLLTLVSGNLTFTAGFLMAGQGDPADVRRQISRWTARGKLVQLRRGLYMLSRPYREDAPHPFHLACRVKKGSYVSLRSALEFHGLMERTAHSVTCVTTGRPERVYTPAGGFVYKHIKASFFFGCARVDLAQGEWCYMATPEKALLDSLYFRKGSGVKGVLAATGLGRVDRIDARTMEDYARKSASRKLQRLAARFRRLQDRHRVGAG